MQQSQAAPAGGAAPPSTPLSFLPEATFPFSSLLPPSTSSKSAPTRWARCAVTNSEGSVSLNEGATEDWGTFCGVVFGEEVFWGEEEEKGRRKSGMR